MHGKWERKREKKKTWIILIFVLVALLVALFLTRGFWLRNEVPVSDEEIFPMDTTVDVPDETDSNTELNETESAETEPANDVNEDQAVVVNIYVNEENHVIMVYSNGKEIDTGVMDEPKDDTQDQFKVVFQDYNGDVLKETYVSSGGKAIPPTTPTRQGYIFAQWDGNINEITADTTFVAMYVQISDDTVVHTVRFVDHDGVVLKTETVLNGNAATAPGAPIRKGYEFTGWDASFDNVTADLTIKAQYKAYTGPEVAIDSVEAAAGSENVAVTISLKNNPGVASLRFAVAFDKNLTLTKVEYNAELDGHTMLPQTMESPATLIWVNPFENETGDWVFATLYFNVADNAKGSLPIVATYDPNDVYDITETNINFRVSNGAITVP